MFSTVYCGAVFGMESYLVQVEVDLSAGLPCFSMVGSPGSEVKESAERVRIALKNMDIRIPPMHIAVNLSPADFKKEGTAFDLPVAIALLMAMEVLPAECGRQGLFLGELGLNGELKPVKGVLPIVHKAQREGLRWVLLPEENVREASILEGIQVVGFRHLGQALSYLKKPSEEQKQWLLGRELKGQQEKEEDAKTGSVDYGELIGQESVKRAALVAAAGFHHMLLVGPPGAGKTMAAKRLPTILPRLSREESLEVSSIYSIAGRLPKEPFMQERPFVSPHHTVSPQALAGGGRIPKPGAISLAHRGVLFLDELPEFKRQTLDILRQPLEEREIQIVRSSGVFRYPADIMLVGAMNPCPCGYYPDRNRCRCSPGEIHRYLSHISGPILDRMDICVEAPRVELPQLHAGKKGEDSRNMREKVMRAREFQRQRYAGTGLRFNADLSGAAIGRYCPLEERERAFAERLYQKLQLSLRAYHRILKVARTIADLEESEKIQVSHLSEAACYRAGEMWIEK